MPWTLYRYLLRDFLKLLALATAVLVLVIGFVLALKPLADGVLGPTSLLRFVLYSTPLSLQFALPFAAAFASTLLFNRLAADNEIVACATSGMSYFSILFPVIGVGLALTAGVFVLNAWLMPAACEQAERLLEKDLPRLLAAKVQRREAVDQLPRIRIYADAADDRRELPKAPPGSGINIHSRITLSGVAVAHLAKDAPHVQSDLTAEQADALVYSYGEAGGSATGETRYVNILLRQVTLHDPERNQLIATHDTVLGPFEVPNPFKDRPLFWRLGKLRQYSQEPDRYHAVRKVALDLATAMTVERLTGEMEKALSPNGQGWVTLLGPAYVDLAHPQAGAGTDEERFELKCRQVSRQGEKLILQAAPGRPVEVVYEGLGSRRIEAQRAELQIKAEAPDPEPRVVLELQEARVFHGTVRPKGNARARLLLPRSRWPGLNVAAAANQRAAALIQEARTQFPQSRQVTTLARHLELTLSQFIRRVIGEFHSRYASALNCCLALLLGAVLSLKLRGSQPLVVYFWTFLLTTLGVVLVHSGRSLVSQVSTDLGLGLAVLWTAPLLLLGAMAVAYVRLARN